MTEQAVNDPDAPRGCPVAHGTGDGLTRLYGPEAATDPRGIYERLREEHGSVAPVLLEGDVPAWLVLGYRDNRRVLDTPRQFTRDARIWRDWREGRVADTSPIMPMVGWRPDCVSQDGEPHRRLRGAVTDGLLAASGRGVRRHATYFANKQIDAFADAGRADLVADYAEYLPMLVLTRILGLPAGTGIGSWNPVRRFSRVGRTPCCTTPASSRSSVSSPSASGRSRVRTSPPRFFSIPRGSMRRRSSCICGWC